MGRGDKKSKKGKRTKGSFGNSRNKKKIKERLNRTARAKSSTLAVEAKPKARKTAKKKEE
ncbi:MAG: 30S ribosomal protein THX [Bacteroidetes bacterium]|nr:30S ribosomal protein THX [Bacteroidota bacterium]